MLKMRNKLIGYFFKVLLLSLVLSSAFLVLLCAGYVDDELLGSQIDLKNTALALYAQSGMDAAHIAQALSAGDCRIRVADESELDESLRAGITQNQSAVTGPYLARRVYFRLGGTLMAAESYPASASLINALLRSLLGNLLLVLTGFLVVYAMSRRMAQPIVSLTEATREIARGNFDVTVNPDLPPFSGNVREIAELNTRFNQMAHDLKGVEYLRRDFTSNLSHELKTPVASIRGYARLLQCDNLTDADRKEYARAIAEESARLANLSDNLSKLTRLERLSAPAPTKRYALDEQLRRCITALHPEIERKGQSVEVDLPRAVIAADEDLLLQVWQNLLGNAIKFTPEGGRLRVTLTKTRGEARVTVEDSGVGMDGATRERIFEKFYQADASHHMGGNGLGLPLVKRILDICGGRIEVTSTPGEGSRFTVILPDNKKEAIP